MENKKRKVKALEVVLYVLAGISLVCAILMTIGAIAYIHSYYSSYGMSVASGWKDAVQYILNNSGNWVVFTLLFFAAARIIARLDTINPDFGKKQKKIEPQMAETAYLQPEAEAIAEAAKEETATAEDSQPTEEPAESNENNR